MASNTNNMVNPDPYVKTIMTVASEQVVAVEERDERWDRQEVQPTGKEAAHPHKSPSRCFPFSSLSPRTFNRSETAPAPKYDGDHQ